MRHTNDQADGHKTRYDPSIANAYAHAARRSISRPHTSMGAAGHWIHLLSVAAPLVIAEVIKDPDKKWRALRLASVGGALLSEAVWTLRLSHDRRREEESRAALEDCEGRCR